MTKVARIATEAHKLTLIHAASTNASGAITERERERELQVLTSTVELRCVSQTLFFLTTLTV